ncbi:MAG: hypothetical protein DRJ50_12690 [Actinobacteria bacterium]|nr:MAG: hypothetical protein DRJ50_12690 [Actinomycetota bacterium]
MADEVAQNCGTEDRESTHGRGSRLVLVLGHGEVGVVLEQDRLALAPGPKRHDQRPCREQ